MTAGPASNAQGTISLAAIARLTERRSSLECPADERERIDDWLREALSIFRRLLPTSHWYAQAAHNIVRSGARAQVVLSLLVSQNPQAELPIDDILSADQEEVLIDDELHREDGAPVQTRIATPQEVRDLALYHPVEWMARFLTVTSVETTARGRVIKAFDLNGLDPRSEYQKACYGPFLERWAADDPHVPAQTIKLRGGRVVRKLKLKTRIHKLGRTKPRQVGSTTFGEKFTVTCIVNIPGFKALLHFPGDSDAKEHLQRVADDCRELHHKWPHYYPAVVRFNIGEGILDLANGSLVRTRHGDVKQGGVSKLGEEWNGVLLSEAGKYERKGGAKVWADINQAILPAVHPGTRNWIIWEGTNDEQANELNRVALLDDVDFQFFGWDWLRAYMGRPILIKDQEVYQDGKYHDEEEGPDGDVVYISEREYSKIHKLTIEQVGFRREKIDELGDLILVHREYPLTYAESLSASSSGFFTKIQQSREPDRIITLRWASPEDAAAYNVHRKPECIDNINGLWHVWDLPDLFDLDGVAIPSEKWTFALAGDFSDGVPQGDYTSLQIARVQDARLFMHARFRAPHAEIANQMALVVAHIGSSQVWVSGELNGPGKAVQTEWMKYHHGLNYTQEVLSASGHGDTERLWFLQGKTTRDASLIAFRGAYHIGRITVCDPRFEWDAEGFVKHENGKYAAQETRSLRTGEKFRDDQVMCAAILWNLIEWLRNRGIGVVKARAQCSTKANDTMVAFLSPKLRAVLSRHMNIPR